MIQYIIRRLLYAIPIIIGVNLLVFFLFFFVNTPDDIAKRQLGERANPMEIENWKRENSYHWPLIINDGYERIVSLENRVDANYGVLVHNDFMSPGDYYVRLNIIEGIRGDVVLTVKKVENPRILSDTRSEGYLNIVYELRDLADLTKDKLLPFDTSKPIEFNSNYHVNLSEIGSFRAQIEEVYERDFGVVVFVKALNTSATKANCKIKLELVKYQNDYVPISEESTIETRGGVTGRIGVVFIPSVKNQDYYLDLASNREGPNDISFIFSSVSSEFYNSYTSEEDIMTRIKKLDKWFDEFKKTPEYANARSASLIKNNILDINQFYNLEFNNQTQESFLRYKIIPKDDDQIVGKVAALFFVIKESGYFPTAMTVSLLEVQPLEFIKHFRDTILFQKGLQLLWFEFGESDNDNIPISYQISQRMWPSLSLTIPMFIIGLIMSVSVSMTLAFFRGTYIDVSGTVICVVIMSINTLFYMILGQLFLAGWLKIFPVSGYDPSFTELWRFVAMPIIIGMVMSLGGNIRFYRTLFLEEISRDYIRTARAKGLGEPKVLFKHALKNAMIPILTSVVMSLPFLFMGSLLFENFFSIPGLGSFTIDAILSNDFSIVRAMVYIGSLLYIFGLIMTDISYVLVDPRIKFS